MLSPPVDFVAAGETRGLVPGFQALGYASRDCNDVGGGRHEKKYVHEVFIGWK